MTAPFITTITPSEGLASGRRVVTIRGMHFNVRVAGDAAPSVSVTFDGVEVDRVEQIARYRLDVVVPAYRGDPDDMPFKADIVVTNLDAAGEPVPGESTTVTEAYTYRRPDMAENPGGRGYETYSELITGALMDELRRNVCSEVASATDPDWSRDPSTGMTAVSELPAILLDGPDDEDAPEYELDDIEDERDGEIAIREARLPVRFSWGIVLVSDRKYEAVRLKDTAKRYFRRRPFIRVPLDATQTEHGEVRVTIGRLSPDDRSHEQTYSFTGTVTIEPVYLDDDVGLADDGIPTGDTTTYPTETLNQETGTHGG